MLERGVWAWSDRIQSLFLNYELKPCHQQPCCGSHSYHHRTTGDHGEVVYSQSHTILNLKAPVNASQHLRFGRDPEEKFQEDTTWSPWISVQLLFHISDHHGPEWTLSYQVIISSSCLHNLVSAFLLGKHGNPPKAAMCLGVLLGTHNFLIFFFLMEWTQSLAHVRQALV